ncbi:14089_t:CDS:2, partial [Dentiscutata erythropus]
QQAEVSEACSSNSDEFNNEFDNIEDSNTKTCSNNGDKFNDEFDNIEDGDTEISIVSDEDANNIITKLLQAVPEVATHRSLVNILDTISADMNNDTIDSDSDFESEFEVKVDSNSKSKFKVEVDKDRSMSSEMLGDVTKQLEKEVKSNKHDESMAKRVEASIIVAKIAGRGVYYAHCIYAWADILMQVMSFLQSNKWSVNPIELAKHINKRVLPSLCFDLLPTMCVKTAEKWLEIFGFEYSLVRKRMYMDSHEHADMIAYHERFLERILRYKTHIIVFF